MIVSCLPVFHSSHCFVASVCMELSRHDLGSCIQSKVKLVLADTMSSYKSVLNGTNIS